MKKYKIMFWIATGLIFLLEGVMPALTWNSAMAQQGFISLGYPIYFGNMLTVFKVVGALVLIIPAIPRRYKEWAYAGFAIDFIAAFVSVAVVGGFGVSLLLPVIAVGLWLMSYLSYDKLHLHKKV